MVNQKWSFNFAVWTYFTNGTIVPITRIFSKFHQLISIIKSPELRKGQNLSFCFIKQRYLGLRELSSVGKNNA